MVNLTFISLIESSYPPCSSVTLFSASLILVLQRATMPSVPSVGAVSENLNSCTHTCIASTLSMEPSHSLYFHNFIQHLSPQWKNIENTIIEIHNGKIIEITNFL